MTTEAANSTPGTGTPPAAPQAQPGQPGAPIAEGTTQHENFVSGVAVAPEVGAWLESQGMKPARLEEFNLPYADPGEYDGEVDRALRTWVARAGFSASNGSELLNEIEYAAGKHERMNATEREIYRRTQDAEIRRVLGPDADARLNLARQLVDEIDETRPGFKRLLEDTGAGNSARLLLLLANQALVLAGRHQQP